jgi:hypothetical protein
MRAFSQRWRGGAVRAVDVAGLAAPPARRSPAVVGLLSAIAAIVLLAAVVCGPAVPLRLLTYPAHPAATSGDPKP